MSSWACRTFSERIARKKREPWGEAGSRLKSRWLAYWMLHLWKKAKTRYEIPSSLTLLGSACSPRLNPQNFDSEKRKRFSPLRMTYRGFMERYALEKMGAPMKGGKPQEWNFSAQTTNGRLFLYFLAPDTKNFTKNKISHCFLTNFVIQW